ncbi:hypothetical protein LXA43DRAFT_253795 [Ganoderma leucocontextum]|nr:hypothetical protein LXA43DRAFT_253795 [Ganoderma leucocontextum]
MLRAGNALQIPPRRGLGTGLGILESVDVLAQAHILPSLSFVRNNAFKETATSTWIIQNMCVAYSSAFAGMYNDARNINWFVSRGVCQTDDLLSQCHASPKGFPWTHSTRQGMFGRGPGEEGNASEHWPSMHPTTCSSVAFSERARATRSRSAFHAFHLVLSIHRLWVTRTRRFASPRPRTRMPVSHRIRTSSTSSGSYS